MSCLAPNGIYRVNGTVHTSGLSGLTLDGRGSTLKRTIRGTTRVVLIDGGGGNLVIRNVGVEGVNPQPGQWNVNYEHEHCWQFGGPKGVLLENVRCKNVGGDGFYLSGGANRWMEDVVIRNSLVDGAGRMALAITDGVMNLRYENNTMVRNGYHCMVVEPNGATVAGRLAGIDGGQFLNNICGPTPYGEYPADRTQADGYAWVATPASGGGSCRNVVVRGNVVLDPNPAYDDFRWNDFIGCSGLNLPNEPQANVRQVKH